MSGPTGPGGRSPQRVELGHEQMRTQMSGRVTFVVSSSALGLWTIIKVLESACRRLRVCSLAREIARDFDDLAMVGHSHDPIFATRRVTLSADSLRA